MTILISRILKSKIINNISIFKIEHSHHNIIDLRRNLTIVINMLINLYGVNSISGSMLNTVMDFLVGHNTKNTIYNAIKLDFNNENIRKIKESEVSQDSHGGIKLIEFFEHKFEFSENTTLRYLFESVLAREINSFEIYSNENIEISFDKFKEIFFQLPFIPDLLRATCCFNNSKKEQYIKTFDKVSVEVYADRGNVKHFIFSNRKVKQNLTLGKL
jgi:hypothetical protein